MKAAFLLSFLIVFVATPAFAADQVSSFSTLPPGDELHIHYITQGCFHSETTDFRFRRDPEPKMTVVRTEPRLREDPPDFKRLTTGSIAFRADELAGLDRLLQIYRSPASFGSTTQHEVTITQLRDGRIIASESYKHVGPRDDAKDISTFDKLSRDMKPSRQ